MGNNNSWIRIITKCVVNILFKKTTHTHTHTHTRTQARTRTHAHTHTHTQVGSNMTETDFF